MESVPPRGSGCVDLSLVLVSTHVAALSYRVVVLTTLHGDNIMMTKSSPLGRPSSMALRLPNYARQLVFVRISIKQEKRECKVH
jgi:hypothetical protein